MVPGYTELVLGIFYYEVCVWGEGGVLKCLYKYKEGNDRPSSVN